MTATFSSLLFLASFSLAADSPDDIPPQPVDGFIDWVYSYDEGKRLANDSGKPLFVVFRCER